MLSQGAWPGGGLGDGQPGVLPTEEQTVPASQDPGEGHRVPGGSDGLCLSPVPTEPAPAQLPLPGADSGFNQGKPAALLTGLTCGFNPAL